MNDTNAKDIGGLNLLENSTDFDNRVRGFIKEIVEGPKMDSENVEHPLQAQNTVR